MTPSVVGSKLVLRYLPVALRHQGFGIVASPLIALMANQVVALRLVSIAAAYFEGVLRRSAGMRFILEFHRD